LLLVVAVAAGGGSLYLQPYMTATSTNEAVADDAYAMDSPLHPIISSGRVETVDGEVDISAQIGGKLGEVRVREGQKVEKDQILAVVEGERQIADVRVAQENVRLAKSRLAHLQAGNGAEEIAQALAAAQAVEAELLYEQRSYERSRKLRAKAVISPEELDQKKQRVEQLQQQLESQRKNFEALRRGPLVEEIEIAKAELALAEAQLAKANVEQELRFVRAPMSGTVIKLHRHAGDAVMIDQITPILRIANTDHLQIRLEIDEADVPLVEAGLVGSFSIRGVAKSAGNLTVRTIVPAFGPKRLFNPDASARHDARTLEILCDAESASPLYPGQRVTAEFRISKKRAEL
jgi:multidrug efflux pump subunit AcrA (membrane-fusion protein)